LLELEFSLKSGRFNSEEQKLAEDDAYRFRKLNETKKSKGELDLESRKANLRCLQMQKMRQSKMAKVREAQLKRIKEARQQKDIEANLNQYWVMINHNLAEKSKK
jgi:hypothetical protein